MNIIFPSSVRECVRMQTNGDWTLYTDMPENFYCERHLKNLAPGNVLDLGCGVGRASVYFYKKYDWRDTLFYLADGNTCAVRYKGKRSKSGEFYNTEQATIDFCKANGLTKFSYTNLETTSFSAIPDPLDLVYSFLAIGFHWPLDFYLPVLHKLCRTGALLIFGIRYDPEDQWIEKQIDAIDRKKYRVQECILCPRESRRSILIMEVV
jgi:SAM-dependent methyltransferase